MPFTMAAIVHTLNMSITFKDHIYHAPEHNTKGYYANGDIFLEIRFINIGTISSENEIVLKSSFIVFLLSTLKRIL